MAFAKGNKLSKGRPVGALNRSTEQMKLTLARAANKTLEKTTGESGYYSRLRIYPHTFIHTMPKSTAALYVCCF